VYASVTGLLVLIAIAASAVPARRAAAVDPVIALRRSSGLRQMARDRVLRSRSTPVGRNGQRPSFRDQQPRFAARQRQPLTDIAAFEAHTIDGSRELARQDHGLHIY
jgi:hypothetical protein